MPPKVAILMAVFEDTRFLSQQLHSIRAQNHGNFEVWVSRDCDGQGMSHALKDSSRLFDKEIFSVLAGPGKGSSANFLSLIHNTDIQADYFAFSDQDDFWEQDKLSRAVDKLGQFPESIPSLYGSRTCLIDENDRSLGLSPLYVRPPSFRNALVQNILSGNTMVMNRAARELLAASGIVDAPVHDWLTYLLVSGAGGRVYFDPYPSVQYRQHGQNLIGLPTSLHERTIRSGRRFFEDQRQKEITTNIRLLHGSRHFLTSDNQWVFDTFSRATTNHLLVRFNAIRDSGVYRQTRTQDVFMLLAALLNRL